jgi:hypothetical protein
VFKLKASHLLSKVLYCLSHASSPCTSSENCLFNSFTYLLTGYLFFWCLFFFWTLHISWILIFYPMNSWQRFSSILRVASSF